MTDYQDIEPFDPLCGPMIPDDMALLERAMLLDQSRCKTCGSEITGEGIGSRASFLSRMMRRAGLCLRCFGVRGNVTTTTGSRT